MVSAAGWPRVRSEIRPWKPGLAPDVASASVRRRHSGSYRAAVVPRIAGQALVLPTPVAALAEEASAEIARFDSELSSEVALFGSVLLQAEAASSSMIENVRSSAKSIALAALGRRDEGDAAEIVSNVAAIAAALDPAERLDADSILRIHEALVAELHPEIVGQWREEQVWIGGTSFGPHQADFIPPHHENVPALIDDLVAFINRDDPPLFAQVAVAHAQFETIHPFLDGNGRAGRALIHAMLRGHGLAQNVTVPLSAGLLTHASAYFAALTIYREGDPSAIVERSAVASIEGITDCRDLLKKLRAIRSGWNDTVKARGGATTWRVADLLLRQPVVDAAAVAGTLRIEPRNAQRAIAPLVDAQVLIEFTGFNRNRMWQAGEVLAALDGFAEAACRRG